MRAPPRRAILFSAALAGLLLLALLAAGCSKPRPEANVLVVGAGVAGLSAALEAADAGASVLVVDMASVFGGHAVAAGGVLNLVATPTQQRQGIQDSPAAALADFLRWGEDANEEWARYYAEHSRAEIHDWLTGMGVEFVAVGGHEGNSVPRLHFPKGNGLALARALYTACLAKPEIRFLWNTQALELVSVDGRVAGIEALELRSRQRKRLLAQAVILATGGMESDLARVRQHWPPHLKQPPRLLAGAARTADGAGLDMAAKAGAALERLDHRWVYALGLPDPRDPAGERGLAVFIPDSIWVNAHGRRFVDETAGARTTLGAVLEQPEASYWAIFDAHGAAGIKVNRPGWDFARIEELILHDTAITHSASSLELLAHKAGLPFPAFLDTVMRHRKMLKAGEDLDFGRWKGAQGQKPGDLSTSPYYAMRFFPITRKSMGGVRIDLAGRALSPEGEPIAGLYAAGEAAGFGGINGKFALEGTFLGPAMLTGRVAGRSAATALPSRVETPAPRQSGQTAVQPAPDTAGGRARASCSECHDLALEASRNRAGYWHFEQSHRVVHFQRLACSGCHPGLEPYRREAHRIDPAALASACAQCHSDPDPE